MIFFVSHHLILNSQLIDKRLHYNQERFIVKSYAMKLNSPKSVFHNSWTLLKSLTAFPQLFIFTSNKTFRADSYKSLIFNVVISCNTYDLTWVQISSIRFSFEGLTDNQSMQTQTSFLDAVQKIAVTLSWVFYISVAETFLLVFL